MFKGYDINRKRVQRLMQLGGIQAIYAGPNTSRRNKLHAVHPYLLRGINIVRPNQVWMIDITYRVPGTQGKQGCLNESRTYLKYPAHAQGITAH